MELTDVKHRHIKMTRRLEEVIQVLLSTESLQFTRLLVLYDANPLVDRNSIVQRCGRCLHLDGTVGNNFWDFPATCLGPVDAQHVVGHMPSENQSIILVRLDLTDIDLIYLNVGGLQYDHE